MEHVSLPEQFWEVAPAAPNIFSYVKSHPSLSQLALEFEYAMIERASNRAVVKFTCLNCARCREAVVWVSALTRIDGSWEITHSIGSMA